MPVCHVLCAVDQEFAYDDEMMTLLDEEQALILEEEELLAIGKEYS